MHTARIFFLFFTKLATINGSSCVHYRTTRTVIPVYDLHLVSSLTLRNRNSPYSHQRAFYLNHSLITYSRCNSQTVIYRDGRRRRMYSTLKHDDNERKTKVDARSRYFYLKSNVSHGVLPGASNGGSLTTMIRSLLDVLHT